MSILQFDIQYKGDAPSHAPIKITINPTFGLKSIIKKSKTALTSQDIDKIINSRLMNYDTSSLNRDIKSIITTYVFNTYIDIFYNIYQKLGDDRHYKVMLDGVTVFDVTNSSQIKLLNQYDDDCDIHDFTLIYKKHKEKFFNNRSRSYGTSWADSWCGHDA